MEELVEPTYWELVAERPEILLPPIVVYFVILWGIPLLASLDEGIRPYWKSMFQIVGVFHAAAIAAGILTWILYPFMVT